MRWTADAIAFAVAQTLFPWRRYVVVPNVSWGLLPHEADLLAMTDAGYLSEVEIKISKADFLADKDKRKHLRGPSDLIKDFYYAMPVAVWDKCSPEDLPQGAGLILCGSRHGYRDQGPWISQKPVSNKLARPCTDAEREQLLRLGYIRYWSRQEAVERLLSAVLRDAESISKEAA